jgi:hypothetical protein
VIYELNLTQICEVVLYKTEVLSRQDKTRQDGDAGTSAIFIWSIYTISFIIVCVSFSELENDTLNQAELNEIKINENN